MDKAKRLLRSLDGKVDAIGLGGIDLYVYAGDTRYTIGDALKLKEAVKKTPVVDGSGLKGSLEAMTVRRLAEEGFHLSGRSCLLTSAVDRFGLAKALTEAGCRMIFGDLMFILNIPKPIYDLETVEELAHELLPKVANKPFHLLYPTGEDQDKEPEGKYAEVYAQAEIIAGDFHMIKKHMPEDLSGKMVLTNTITAGDVEALRARGVTYLVTTTPEFSGRSFGANVMEALLVTFLDKPWEEVKPDDYVDLIGKLDMKPRIELINPEGADKWKALSQVP